MDDNVIIIVILCLFLRSDTARIMIVMRIVIVTSNFRPLVSHIISLISRIVT